MGVIQRRDSSFPSRKHHWAPKALREYLKMSRTRNKHFLPFRDPTRADDYEMKNAKGRYNL
jgi:hypothetical protein